MDLGTYHIEVKFTDGRGYIERYDTGIRFSGEDRYISPLNASPIEPRWNTENDLISTILHQYTQGNYSCDCNRLGFIYRSLGFDFDNECGSTMELQSIVLIRPDYSRVEIYPSAS